MSNLIVLPDGSEISSGPGNITAIKSCQYTDMVNDSEDLRLGSVCSNSVDVSIMAPDGLAVAAGDEITLYKVNGTGRKKKGVYTVERPTQPSAATVKLTGFDHVAKLDKDLTQWLANLKGWPYTLLQFAGMVCEACGLTLVTQEIPNGNHPVEKFSQTGITGRKLMRWIGECCCRFTRANADGNIELAWYEPSSVTLTPTGEKYYFQGSFSSEKYTVAPIDAVQIMFAHADGYKWPEAEEGANSYVISGNPFLSSTAEKNRTALQVILQELQGVAYTPCKVSIPDAYGVEAGHSVQIAARNGQTVTAYVMKKTTRGLRADLECTGNTRRDSSGAVNDQTAQQVAQNAVNAQTPQDVFDKLTDYGKIQGLYIKDDKLYINAELVQIVNLVVQALRAEEQREDGFTGIIETDNGSLRVYGDDGTKKRELMNVNAYASSINPSTSWGAMYIYEFDEGELNARTFIQPSNFQMSSYPNAMREKGHSFSVMMDGNTGQFIVSMDDIRCNAYGKMEWEYIEALGKTVLVRTE